jgi:hypothetical protein
MAAVAPDVAALRLRSRDAQLNFLVSVGWLPRPASTHPADARAAAAEATDRVRREPALVEARCHEELCDFDGLCRAELAVSDKEFVLDLRPPRLWAEMSETMLLDPLRQCVSVGSDFLPSMLFCYLVCCLDSCYLHDDIMKGITDIMIFNS